MKALLSMIAAMVVLLGMSFSANATGGSETFRLSQYVCSDYSPNVVTGAGNTDNCINRADFQPGPSGDMEFDEARLEVVDTKDDGDDDCD